MARVKTVGYGVTKTLPGFNNVRVYYEAELDDDDEAPNVIRALKKLVLEETGGSDDVENLRNERIALQ